MNESAHPLGPLVLMIAGVLLALAVFWVGFMLAPAAVLVIFYLALSAGERARRQRAQTSDPPEMPPALTAEAEGDRETVSVSQQPRGVRA